MMLIKLTDDHVKFHTADGMTASGPGHIRITRESLQSPYKIFLYSHDHGSNRRQTGHHLGTYDNMADAEHEMESIDRAINSGASNYYMSDVGAGFDDPEAPSDEIGDDGKKYPKNQRRNREKIALTILNNPTASNNAIAKMTGTSPHTVQKCRELFNQNQSGKE